MMLYTHKSQVNFTKKEDQMKKIDTGVTMSLGAGIGAAMGVAFDNIAMGVALARQLEPYWAGLYP